MVRSLLESHGLELTAHEDWLLPNGRLPAIRPLWFEEPDSAGRLDVQVLLDDERLAVESFAGVGTGPEALHDAIANLTINSLHVFLSALWGISLPEQVTVEDWEFSGVRRLVHIGNFGRHKFAGPDVPVPVELFPAIERALRSESLSPAHHWFRTYACHLPSQPFTLEALFDNQEWSAGAAALATVPWPESAQFYSVRNFIFIPAAIQ
jgi:hypothetical protein